MTTASSTSHGTTADGQRVAVTCHIEGRATDLYDDAASGSMAAAEALSGITLTRPIADLIAEHAAALEGDGTWSPGQATVDPTETEYHRLADELAGIAHAAATAAWHDPNGAWVTVDVEG